MRHAYFLKHRNDNMTKPPTSYVTDKMIGVFFVKVVFLYKMRKIYRNEKTQLVNLSKKIYKLSLDNRWLFGLFYFS